MKTCPKCGAPLAEDRLGGHCPACLMHKAVNPDHDDSVLDNGETSAESVSGEQPPIDWLKRPTTRERMCTSGDYEVLEKIGHGGMGVVYKARQISLNRLVALKMIRSGAFATSAEVQRFLNEAQAVASLEHPNIVALYTVGKNDGQYFLSMQLTHGSDLAKVIQAREDSGQTPALPCRQAVEIMIKVARAVLHAHQRRVLHRDLKPSNILLDEQGEPHVVDFGVAKRIDVPTGMTPQGSAIGTPGYMSPEQAQGRNDELTTLTDVYGLGAVLYFLLTGLPPIRGKSDLETLQMVSDKEPVRPSLRNPKVNRYLEIICLNCLEKEPQQRYPSAELLAEDLERWLEGLPPKKTPVGLVERSIRLVRRNPALACAMAAVFVLLFSVIYLQRKKAEEQKIAIERMHHIVMQQLEEMWNDPERDYSSIESEDRRALDGKKPLAFGRGYTTRPALVFAVYCQKEPTKMLTNFCAVLGYLEAKLNTPINFRIYKGYSKAVDALVKGEVGFMRTGPASYVLARKRTNVVLLVKQIHKGKPVMYGSIFTREAMPITNRHDLATYPGLKNLRFAFGDEESTFGSYLARVWLVEGGIYATNMADPDGHNHFSSHPATVNAVLSDTNLIAGAANAGVVKEKIDDERAKLRIIATMESVTFPWVAAANLHPDRVDEIKKCLLQLKDPTILKWLESDKALDGFQEAGRKDYDEMERQMRKAEQFEKGRSK